MIETISVTFHTTIFIGHKMCFVRKYEKKYRKFLLTEQFEYNNRLKRYFWEQVVSY